MKLLAAEVTNFGSYRHLSFKFDDLGLALVYGATGSGKSTVQDIATWILFGQTAKDGNADDIRSWGCEESTKGILQIETGDSTIQVIRIRGKSGQNDLYWIKEEQIHRGKDIVETQEFLNKLLALDYYTYLTGAYYNEFSPTGQFFISKASDRRLLLDSLVDLSLPVQLVERISNVKKETRKTLLQISEEFNKTDGKLEQLRRFQIAYKRDAESWSAKQKETIHELQIKCEKFGEEKASKIEVEKLKSERFQANTAIQIDKYNQDLKKKISKFARDNQCPSCGALKAKDERDLIELNEEYEELIKTAQLAKNPHVEMQQTIFNQENPYQERLQEELVRSNPYLDQITKSEKELVTLQLHYKDLKNQVDTLNHKVNSLDQLRKIADKLREELCKNTLKRLEEETNRYLKLYFDSEISVNFEISNGDKVEVNIKKSGYDCSYKQLSKGQRSLLKLTFSVSAMKLLADKCGIHFETLMFDEALDGLDTSLKLKAFNLFSELNLSHNTILIIDHNEELQSLFSHKYYVTMESDISTITEV